jgi:Ca2+-binding EF-hand superfamily protein
VLACSCLYPNPSSLRESLAFFDERKNGTLDKVKTKEILTSVGEGVSNEEIGLFYEEFQDWKLYEQQRQ